MNSISLILLIFYFLLNTSWKYFFTRGASWLKRGASRRGASCPDSRTLIILVQDKNTSLKLLVGVSPLQLVNLHRNRRYFVIKLHTWFCLSYFLKTNIKFYCIYQYFMSINSFFNTVSVSRYSRPNTVTGDPL